MSDSVIYDVVVIGGGPAGLVSALLMSRTGKKVALLDKPVALLGKSVTRLEKVGESMPASTNRLLKHLELPLLSHPTHDAIAGSDSYWAGRYEQQDFIYHLQGCDWRLNRVQFESDLQQCAQNSGVIFIEDLLDTLHQEGNGWRVETQKKQRLQADFIIDASGRSGVLSRYFSLEREKTEPLIALWASVDIEDACYDGMTSNTLIESQDNGWWYAARLPTKKQIVIYHTSANHAGLFKKRPQRWLDALHNTQIIAKKMPLQYFRDNAFQLNVNNARSSYLTTPYGDNWAACGDAAISFDPLSSQGIYNAIATAATLNKALLSNNRKEALAQYGESLKNVMSTYQQKRRQYYQQASDYYQTPFWEQQR